MFPRWIGWLFLAFLGYILYLGNFSSQRHEPVTSEAPKQEATPEPDNAVKYPKIAEFTDKDRWLRAVDPGHISPAHWRDVKEGEGEGAVCGESLKVKISGLAGKKGETHSFRLGNAPYPVLDSALEGLKPGGVRQVSSPPDKVYKKPGKDKQHMVDFTVERLDNIPTAAK